MSGTRYGMKVYNDEWSISSDKLGAKEFIREKLPLYQKMYTMIVIKPTKMKANENETFYFNWVTQQKPTMRLKNWWNAS